MLVGLMGDLTRMEGERRRDLKVERVDKRPIAGRRDPPELLQEECEGCACRRSSQVVIKYEFSRAGNSREVPLRR